MVNSFWLYYSMYNDLDYVMVKPEYLVGSDRTLRTEMRYIYEPRFQYSISSIHSKISNIKNKPKYNKYEQILNTFQQSIY